MRACFYDTWGFIALANRGDPHHGLAVDTDRYLEEAGYVAVTSDYVFDETVTGLHAAAGARAALEFVDFTLASLAAGELLLLETNRERRERAIVMFRRLAPSLPRLSFTDCTSFALMRELEIPVAFTADRHFLRAGRGLGPLFEQGAGGLALRLPQ